MTARTRILTGVAGVATFVTSWIVAGLLRDGYSPWRDAISRLAELGATDRWIVSVGMVAFGTGAILFAPVFGRRAAVALTVAGGASLGVAAFPCTSGCPGPGSVTDTAHTVFAGVHYVALTALPILESRSGFARAVTLIAGAALALHAVGVGPNGALQRLGLTTLDVWLVATAVKLWRAPMSPLPDNYKGGRP